MSTERDRQPALRPADRWVRVLVALTVVALAATVAVRCWPRPPVASDRELGKDRGGRKAVTGTGLDAWFAQLRAQQPRR